MPLLRKANAVRIKLPSTKDLPEEDQAWVDLKDTMLTGEMVGLTQGDGYKERVLYGLVEAIVDWNLEDLVPDPDKEGQEKRIKAPIDIFHVARLEQEDFFFLADEMERIKKEQDETPAIENEEKKTSSATLNPSISPETPKPPQI